MAMLTPSRDLIRYWRSIESSQGLFARTCHRNFCAGRTAYSGHSKWATIKHDKARNDAHKNRERTVMAKEIVNAVRCKHFNLVAGLIKLY